MIIRRAKNDNWGFGLAFGKHPNEPLLFQLRWGFYDYSLEFSPNDYDWDDFEIIYPRGRKHE